ncbi:MAG: hypothetical protein KTR16_10225 [Acidiferrobacterales bacterium]|nr:hypothetical protein [Acidiferrobacterales bacterium]
MNIKSLVSTSKSVLVMGCLGGVVACGGSGYGSDDDDYGSTPTAPAPVVSPTPSVGTATFETSETSMGGTFSVNGIVSVLNYDSTTASFVAADEDRSLMSLYIFDNDPVGASACNSQQCVTSWPPLLADDSLSVDLPFSVITRDDGNAQIALRGKPLYYFAGDSVPGDVNGEGVGGVWHAAQNEPVILVDDSVASNAGEYMVASGTVAVSAAEQGSSSSFVSERRDMAGMSLYTFDNDSDGQSNCNGPCLVNWPALLADENDVAQSPYSIISRQMNESGGVARQWAYKGKPLYFFFQDTVAGDTLGKDIGNWTLLRPSPFLRSVNNSDFLAASGLVKSAEPDSNGDEVISFEPKYLHSLYTFDNDEVGVSNCSGQCLSNWPALMAHDGAVAEAPYSLITRVNGEQQWALNGKPLYFFHLDESPGDILGDGVGSVWHLADVSDEDDGGGDDGGGGYGY